MSTSFFTSWKGAFVCAGIAVILVSGYKLFFGPDRETRLLQTRMRIAYPSGEPSAEIMDRQVVAATPWTPVQFTLRQSTNYLVASRFTLTWDPVDPEAFVLRASGVDALTRKPEEYAFSFVRLAGPEAGGGIPGSFKGPAVGLSGMAFNRVQIGEGEIAQFLIANVTDIRALPTDLPASQPSSQPSPR
ncbi:hypothetical protein ABLE91_26735 [Aquabacter sp. CN5-332]|uniref:hypothetical protein n=1 Tax=Aquabacter sp. CN5-332 TaxID=3156608 RepID=UPI0032B5E7CB